MRKEEILVMLGTAHLATTPGKRSPDGQFREAMYSREIVALVEAQLKARGINVLVDYKPLEPNGEMRAATAKEEQRRELNWRTRWVNANCRKIGTKKCLYVPIHVNAAGSGGKWLTAGGWCCYTSVGQTQGDKLADRLYQAAREHLTGCEQQLLAGKKTGAYDGRQRYIRTDASDGDPDMEANFAVLANTNCAAALTENLFQDNHSDVAFLTSDEGKAAIVAIHVDGITRYIEEDLLK